MEKQNTKRIYFKISRIQLRRVKKNNSLRQCKYYEKYYNRRKLFLLLINKY